MEALGPAFSKIGGGQYVRVDLPFISDLEMSTLTSRVHTPDFQRSKIRRGPCSEELKIDWLELVTSLFFCPSLIYVTSKKACSKLKARPFCAQHRGDLIVLKGS